MRDIRAEIEETLHEIEQREAVRVLYAVESGSRAWGVESPDSDYDVRFVYMRPKEDYLKLEEIRDVIEWQLDEVLDINGWDLRKTLIQFHKGNATLFEWSNSPIVYRDTPKWRQIYGIARRYFSEKAAMYHYYGTAKSTYEQYLTGEQVRYKKYIYALRPLLACKYIEERHAVPPVLFHELMKQELSETLRREIEQILETKSSTDEKTLHPQMPAVRAYIREELARLETVAKEMSDDRTPEWEPLDEVFMRILPLIR